MKRQATHPRRTARRRSALARRMVDREYYQGVIDTIKGTGDTLPATVKAAIRGHHPNGTLTKVRVPFVPWTTVWGLAASKGVRGTATNIACGYSKGKPQASTICASSSHSKGSSYTSTIFIPPGSFYSLKYK